MLYRSHSQKDPFKLQTLGDINFDGPATHGAKGPRVAHSPWEPSHLPSFCLGTAPFHVLHSDHSLAPAPGPLPGYALYSLTFSLTSLFSCVSSSPPLENKIHLSTLKLHFWLPYQVSLQRPPANMHRHTHLPPTVYQLAASVSSRELGAEHLFRVGALSPPLQVLL